MKANSSSSTYIKPSRKAVVTPIFFSLGMFKPHTTGIGNETINRSTVRLKLPEANSTLVMSPHVLLTVISQLAFIGRQSRAIVNTDAIQ